MLQWSYKLAGIQQKQWDEYLFWWAWKTPVNKKHKPDIAPHALLSLHGFNIATPSAAYAYHETHLTEGHVTLGHSWKSQRCTLTLEHTSWMYARPALDISMDWSVNTQLHKQVNLKTVFITLYLSKN